MSWFSKFQKRVKHNKALWKTIHRAEKPVLLAAAALIPGVGPALSGFLSAGASVFAGAGGLAGLSAFISAGQSLLGVAARGNLKSSVSDPE